MGKPEFSSVTLIPLPEFQLREFVLVLREEPEGVLGTEVEGITAPEQVPLPPLEKYTVTTDVADADSGLDISHLAFPNLQGQIDTPILAVEIGRLNLDGIEIPSIVEVLFALEYLLQLEIFALGDNEFPPDQTLGNPSTSYFISARR
jgi:hypothetical protein